MEMHIKQKINPKFFVDAMLGNIAKKLRLMGFDVEYLADVKDDHLINKAKSEERIIISKDKELIQKSVKIGINSLFVNSQKEIEQLREIIKKFDLKNVKIDGNIARCPKCNLKTQSISKHKIKKRIPNKIFENNEKFWECKFCEKIFWEGTHIKNLQRIVEEING